MPTTHTPSRGQPQSRTLALAKIGNSRGVRLPKEVLARYGMSDAVVMELRPEGVLLRPMDDPRVSWETTFAEMAAEAEDWSDLDSASGDGLDTVLWHNP